MHNEYKIECTTVHSLYRYVCGFTTGSISECFKDWSHWTVDKYKYVNQLISHYILSLIIKNCAFKILDK